MNILCICNYEFYDFYSSSFVHQQAIAYEKRGHKVRVVVLTPIGKGKKNKWTFFSEMCRVDDVEVLYLKYISLSRFGKKWFNFMSTKFFCCINRKKILKNFVPDFIHSHTIGNSRVGAFLKKSKSCPVIATAHGSDVNVPFFAENYAHICRECEYADAIIAVSSSLKERLLKCGVLKPIYVVLNGFNNRNVITNSEKKHNSWIQVGHLIKGKRVDNTIKAFAEWQKDYPDATLTIIGEGIEKQNLVHLCEKKGIVSKVRFLGQLSNSQALSEMAMSQYFIMVSFPEGFGIVYLEAMASGCVTIGTKGEGIEDVISNGNNGFLVSLDSPQEVINVVNRCQKDIDARERLVVNAKNTVNKLTWEENVIEIEKVFSGMRGSIVNDSV